MDCDYSDERIVLFSSSDATVPSEPLGSYPTKSVSIYYLNFSKKNYLQAAGS